MVLSKGTAIAGNLPQAYQWPGSNEDLVHPHSRGHLNVYHSIKSLVRKTVRSYVTVLASEMLPASLYVIARGLCVKLHS